MTARAGRTAPAASLWDWHDQAVCCLCAPHCTILTEGDRAFLWRLDRRRYPPRSEQRQRLERLVTVLDHYALGHGIIWP